MKVIINNQTLYLFKGARVRDAINTFASEYPGNMPDEPYSVTDRDGNMVMPDGRLSENDKLFIKPKNS